MITDYDYIVSGLGCAGMSFMHYLLESPLKNNKIRLIDSSTKTKNDRTWCYWSKEPLKIHPKSKPIISWDKIKIKNSKECLTKDLDELKYYHVRSSDFYRESLVKIKKHPNVTLLVDTVLSITSNEHNTITITTKKKGAFTAKKVFNSIPLNSKLKKDLLRQVFVGWEVNTNENIFDPKVATLMDFVDKSELLEFFYVLPFDSQTALIEYTAYTTGFCDQEAMEQKISHYIKENYGVTNYTIQYKESGSIPMSTQSFIKKEHPNIIPLGTLGGCTKPSTGYTFYDIQKHCKQVVKQLSQAEYKSNFRWKRPFRFHFYDNVLLNIAKKWPSRLPNIFSEMFQKNSAKAILNFLSEETSLSEEIQLLWKLKFGIFIKSLFHYEKH